MDEIVESSFLMGRGLIEVEAIDAVNCHGFRKWRAAWIRFKDRARFISFTKGNSGDQLVVLVYAEEFTRGWRNQGNHPLWDAVVAVCFQRKQEVFGIGSLSFSPPTKCTSHGWVLELDGAD